MAVTTFSEVALDHATRPRNRGPLARYHGHARITGPCGDTMEVWLRVEDESVAAISFTTDGCGSSLACGSMATCLAEGAPLEQARALAQQDVLDALGDFPSESEHCALLASIAVRAAVADYQQAVSRGDPTAIHGVIEDPGRLPRERHDKETLMRIAIPLAGGQLSAHFGHCQTFALVDVDADKRAIVTREDVAAPPHEPGLLPAWLAERGANMIIAGGMGQRAQDLFAGQGIDVVVGAPAAAPEQTRDRLPGRCAARRREQLRPLRRVARRLALERSHGADGHRPAAFAARGERRSACSLPKASPSVSSTRTRPRAVRRLLPWNEHRFVGRRRRPFFAPLRPRRPESCPAVSTWRTS